MAAARAAERTALSALRSVAALREAGLLEAADDTVLEAVAERYSVAVSEAVLDTIDVANLDADPVARQYVPDPRELLSTPLDRADPIGDNAYSPMPGLVHRYPDRVLLKATAVCPVYCRFCFRRESVGANAERPLTTEQFEAIFTYVESHPEIWEVIVSGGDPLVLSDQRLQQLLDGLARSSHVKVVRIHTRVPVVMPERITPTLMGLLRSTGKTVYVAVHANHPNEFSAEARAACAGLVDAGVPLLSQSVLLRGVNDNVETLGALMRCFVEQRITPYYLHQLDLAPGTEHFRVSIERGQTLLRALRGTWSGLCQPNYVIDLPGGYGKVPIGPSYVSAPASAGAEQTISDINGAEHRYPPACGDS